MDYVKFIYRPLRHAQHIMSWSVEIARGSQQIGVALRAPTWMTS